MNITIKPLDEYARVNVDDVKKHLRGCNVGKLGPGFLSNFVSTATEFFAIFRFSVVAFFSH